MLSSPLFNAWRKPIFPWKKPCWFTSVEDCWRLGHTGMPSDRLACKPMGMLCLTQEQHSSVKPCDATTGKHLSMFKGTVTLFLIINTTSLSKYSCEKENPLLWNSLFVFSMTVSHHHRGNVLLPNSAALVHRGLWAYVYAQLSQGPVTVGSKSRVSHCNTLVHFFVDILFLIWWCTWKE